MPIYEYRCDSCGFQKEYLLRMSDAPLTVCPQCNKPTFSKMVTAAGFQLKGGGWYVTDFKSGGSNTGAPKKAEEKQKDTSVQSDSAKADKPKADAASSAASATAPATSSTPAPSTSSSGS